MTTLIIDAPEVVQHVLADTCEARGIGYRLVPDRRTEVTTSDTTADAADHDLAAEAAGATAAIWFETGDGGSDQAPQDIVDVLAGAAVARVMLVTPLRGSRQPVSMAAQTLDSASSRFPGGVTIVAAAPPYGPGDEVVSRLLIMMRSLPVVPVLAHGERRYQPIWHEDLAEALLMLLDAGPDTTAACRVAGPDVVTQNSLYEAMAPLIDRRPVRVPVPDLLTRLGLSVIDLTSGTTTAADERVWAIDADDQPLPHSENDLPRLLGRAPTRLDEALRRLVVSLPEQLPGTGVGSLEVKRFWGVIRGTALTPSGVIALLRDRFADVMPVPVGVEPGAPATRLTEGATVTLHLPGRGHVQVRVEAADDAHVVLSTLRGHPLAGVVRFVAAQAAQGVRFEVMTADKAATPVDWLALTLGGARIQDANWRAVVRRVGEMAGGTVDPVHWSRRYASPDEVRQLSTWVARLIDARES